MDVPVKNGTGAQVKPRSVCRPLGRLASGRREHEERLQHTCVSKSGRRSQLEMSTVSILEGPADQIIHSQRSEKQTIRTYLAQVTEQKG